MSDPTPENLPDRLRDTLCYGSDDPNRCGPCTECDLAVAAADRIEELEAQLDDANALLCAIEDDLPISLEDYMPDWYA